MNSNCSFSEWLSRLPAFPVRLVVSPPVRKSVSIQTEDDRILRLGQEASRMRAQAFSCLDVLPAVLSMCSFTGNDRDWAVEKPCFQSLQRYQESMEVNLIRFEQLLVELGQDAKTEHQRMLAEAYRCLYIMNARACTTTTTATTTATNSYCFKLVGGDISE